MTEGGIPAANIMSLCSANSASYMSPVQSKYISSIAAGARNELSTRILESSFEMWICAANDSAMLRGYGEE